MQIQAPKGMKDVTPKESYKWQYIEKLMRSACAEFGYRETRTPVLEHTELFARGVGDTTDIVQKEMYTFTDKGDRSVTLKPEGTAAHACACSLKTSFLPTRSPQRCSIFTAPFSATKSRRRAG